MHVCKLLALLAVTATVSAAPIRQQYGTVIRHRGGAHRPGREEDPDSPRSSVGSSATPAASQSTTGGWRGDDSDDEVTSYYTAPSS
ncbi:hypothetical protein PoMZ_12614 [Pyricularia oryzae]|uniref:Uncharacterized protein n=1 Tax=Pyricularia oryzae TaxID=318829 RepID=A0A4P7NT75_PYROR|nr:hypothetical protein PoMZ_12614 [Pyricularia oryzae]